MSRILSASHVDVSFGDWQVLHDASLSVDPGHRAGLVGENGAGKSTLLRVLAGELEPDGGEVIRPEDLGYLPQEFEAAPGATVGDVIDSALTAMRRLEADLEKAAAELTESAAGPGVSASADRYDLALSRVEAAEAWDADARAARTVQGLGLDVQAFADRPVETLSGGQRTRLGLAALLIRRPSALLLDEPTNHLDDDAAEYLAGALRAAGGAVLLASHDRVFLNEVCTEILDMDPAPSFLAHEQAAGGSIRRYGGTYDDFLDARKKERLRWEQTYAEQQEELTGLRHTVAVTGRRVAPGRGPTDNDKFIHAFKGSRVQNQVSRRVRNAQTRLDTLQSEQVRKPPRVLTFTPAAQPPAMADGVVLSVRRAVVPGRLDMTAAKVPDLDISAGAKVLITGDNGSGKSTLLHLLAGDIEPSSGSVQRSRGIKVALLEQDVALADESRTPRSLLAMAAGTPIDGHDRLPRVESHGLLGAWNLDRPVRELSVGQQRRVVLAMLLTQTPEVLLLDEPTNHISLALADELMAAVKEWPGAVVVASHDRWLRRTWEGQTVRLG